MSGKYVNVTRTDMEAFRVELLEAAEPAEPSPTTLFGVDWMFSAAALALALCMLVGVVVTIAQAIH